MIRFKFWEPVYYQDWTDKSGTVLMNPGRFAGVACNIGESMNFKVLQFNEDLHKRNIFFNRGVIVPHSPIEIGYSSALAPKSNNYFPDVKVEGGATSKTSILGHQGTVDPPNITITEGGVKRQKPLSLPSKSVDLDRSTAGSNEAVMGGPGITDVSPAMANRGDMNGDGTTDEIDWDAIGK